jgi:hypothetical protein
VSQFAGAVFPRSFPFVWQKIVSKIDGVRNERMKQVILFGGLSYHFFV